MLANNKNYSDQFLLNPSPELSDIKYKRHIFEPHVFIKQEGDVADSIFFVESGFLIMSKTTCDGRRQIINFVFPGEYCGISKRKKYIYDIECLSFSSLRIMSRHDFESSVGSNIRMIKEIYDQMIIWSDGMDELIFLLGTKTAEAKTASFLLFLHIRQQRYFTDPSYREIPLSRTDIGDFLGLRVETVSRTLSKFKKSNLIEIIENNRIKILNFKPLVKIADIENRWKQWDQKHTHHS